MILFENDWDDYPNAIVHNNTKNTSFLRLSYIYKKRGVKNHLFLLALHNPDLRDLDPHSPDLTFVELLAVAKEARENYWYYLRECVRVTIPGSIEPGYFEANRANIAHAWNFWNYVNTLTILIRQKGKSLQHDVLSNHLLHLSTNKSNLQLLTKDSNLRSENTERIKDLYLKLPLALKTANKKDKQNTDIIENTNTGSTMKILLAQKSIIAAKNVGRGPTIVVHSVDELCYDYNIEESLPAMLSSGTTAKRLAMAAGRPAGTCLYTTVGYLDSKSGAFGHKLYKGALDWSDDFYDIPNREELHKIIVNNTTGIMDLMLIEFNHKELGMSDKELAVAIRAAGASGVKAEVEFLNKWAMGSSDSALTRKQIKIINESKVEPIHSEIGANGFVLKWYKYKEDYIDKPLVIGMDLSEMIGNDSGSLVGLDPITGETVVTGDYNTSNINDFGEFVYWFLDKYTRSVLIGERKSVMLAIFDQVANLFGKSDNIFKRLFNKSTDDREVVNLISYDKDYLRAYNIARKGFGYMTSGSGSQSRDNLFNKLLDSVDLLGNVMKDKLLISQMTKLEKKNNRIDHVNGEHDDMVISYLLVQWLLTSAKNITYYGLNKQTILTAVISGDDKDIADRKIRERNESIVYSINKILLDMENEESNMVRLRYIMRIKMLKKELVNYESKTLNIEGRLEEITNKHNKK